MKKVKRSIKIDLLNMSIVPIVILVVIISLVAGFTLKSNIVDEVEDGLKGTVITAIKVLDKGTNGDIAKDSAGNIKKGDFTIGKNNDLVDSIKKETGTDVTIFAGDTRVTSSVLDNDGKRVLGTKASEKVIEQVLKNGNTYFDQKVNVQGVNYFGYYSPMKDQSGQIIGMVFAGKPSKDVEKTLVRNNLIIIFIGFLVTILAAFLVIKKSRKITNALVAVSDYLLDVSKGDLRQTINKEYIERKDEIGLIAKTSEELKDNLRSLIGKTSEAGNLLLDHSNDLQTMSKNCLESTQSVDIAMNEISGTAVSQADNTQDASKKLIDIGELIKIIYSSIKSLHESTDNMSKAESEVDRIVKDSTAYNDITIQSVKRISEQADKTNESAKKIKEAIELITAIAEQTNLLSLNASIEAARAG